MDKAEAKPVREVQEGQGSEEETSLQDYWRRTLQETDYKATADKEPEGKA